MTKAETAKIMATLWAAYPGFYSKAGNGDQAAAVELWQKCFEAEPYELVSAAVYALTPSFYRGRGDEDVCQFRAGGTGDAK